MTDLYDPDVAFEIGDVVLAPKSRFPTTEFIVGMHHVHEYYSNDANPAKSFMHSYMLFRRDALESEDDTVLQVRGKSLEVVEKATEETIAIASEYMSYSIDEAEEDESDEYYIEPSSMFGCLVKTTMGNFLVVKENEDADLESEGIKECVVINVDDNRATFLRLTIGDDTDPDKYDRFKEAQIQDAILKSMNHEGEHGEKLNFKFLVEQGVIVE